jgi:uncharacterized membrane protein
MANEKTKTGLPRNTVAALAYVFGPVSGVIFLLLEKDPFIRFHAAQSIVVIGGLSLLWMLLPFTIILLPLTPLIFVGLFILWLMLIYRSWQGDEWEVPFLGKYARMLVRKVEKS